MITEKLDRLPLEPHSKWVKAHGVTHSEEHEPTACRKYASELGPWHLKVCLMLSQQATYSTGELPLKSQHLVVWYGGGSGDISSIGSTDCSCRGLAFTEHPRGNSELSATPALEDVMSCHCAGPFLKLILSGHFVIATEKKLRPTMEVLEASRDDFLLIDALFLPEACLPPGMPTARS